MSYNLIMPKILKEIELAPIGRVDPRKGAIVDTSKRLFGGKRSDYLQPDEHGVDLVLVSMVSDLMLGNSLTGNLEDRARIAHVDTNKLAERLGRDLDERLVDIVDRIGLNEAAISFGSLLGGKLLVPFLAGIVAQSFAPRTLIGIADINNREEMLSRQLFVPNESVAFSSRDQVQVVGQILGTCSNRLREAPGAFFGSY